MTQFWTKIAQQIQARPSDFFSIRKQVTQDLLSVYGEAAVEQMFKQRLSDCGVVRFPESFETLRDAAFYTLCF